MRPHEGALRAAVKHFHILYALRLYHRLYDFRLGTVICRHISVLGQLERFGRVWQRVGFDFGCQ